MKHAINLYFIRHFPTASNKDNLWCGCGSNLSIDFDLAKKIKKKNLKEIDSIKFDYVCVSPLNRCIETAKLLGFNQYIIDPLIIERNFGNLEQKPCSAELKDKLADWDLNTTLDGSVEPIQSIYYDRLVPFLNKLNKLPDQSNVLVISHSWIGRLLKYHFTKNKEDIKKAPINGELLAWSYKYEK